jgi:hypothetical protein
MVAAFLWTGYNKKDQPLLSIVDLEEIFAYMGLVMFFSIFGKLFLFYRPNVYTGFLTTGYVFITVLSSLLYVKNVYVWKLRKVS